MKKFMATLGAVAMTLTLTACGSNKASSTASSAASSASSTSEVVAGEGKYTVYNTTGETVTELTLVENGKDVESENYAGNGLEDGKSVEITTTAEDAENTSYTLTYKTESGREGKFETLHVEETPISLLAEDAMTGATPIAFSAPEK